MSATEPRWSHEEVIVNGVRLHYVRAGPADGPLVVLLHGFPEFWYSWREQIPALAAAGYRVVAPDMRGYDRSEKPHGVGSYRIEHLVGDVAGLVDAFGEERAHVVGHDWGGVVAWATAMHRPEVVDRLAVLNAPHPYALVRRSSPRQALRSWYALYFQLPWLPEAGLRARDHAVVRRMFREGPDRPFDEADIRRYERALSTPGATTSAVNYYRAFARHDFPRYVRDALPVVGDPDVIDAETLLLWGEEDPALGVELTEDLEPWVPNVRVERFPGASHWLGTDRPDEVNAALRRFLGGADG